MSKNLLSNLPELYTQLYGEEKANLRAEPSTSVENSFAGIRVAKPWAADYNNYPRKAILLCIVKREPNLKAGQAVLLGHLVVNVPVLTIIGLAYLIGYISIGPDRAIFCVPVGAVMAWVWWSAIVPRWREWVKNQGADEVRTQHLAQVTGLVWPKGSFLEKTEFRLRKRG